MSWKVSKICSFTTFGFDTLSDEKRQISELLVFGMGKLGFIGLLLSRPSVMFKSFAKSPESIWTLSCLASFDKLSLSELILRITPSVSTFVGICKWKRARRKERISSSPLQTDHVRILRTASFLILLLKILSFKASSIKAVIASWSAMSEAGGRRGEREKGVESIGIWPSSSPNGESASFRETIFWRGDYGSEICAH